MSSSLFTEQHNPCIPFPSDLIYSKLLSISSSRTSSYRITLLLPLTPALGGGAYFSQFIASWKIIWYQTYCTIGFEARFSNWNFSVWGINFWVKLEKCDLYDVGMAWNIRDPACPHQCFYGPLGFITKTMQTGPNLYWWKHRFFII